MPAPVHERIAEVLKELGAEAAFTLMSEDIAKLIVDLERLGVRIYSTRHDSTAVGMADGFARTSGRVGVALIGRGPALTNALNPLITARKAGSRVLVLTGETPLDPERAKAAKAEPMGKYLDQVGLLQSAAVDSILVSDASLVARQVEDAFSRAETGRVTVLRLPTDLLDSTIAAEGPRGAVRQSLPAAVPAAVDINQVADLLAESWAAQRPIVLAGAGAVKAGAHDELVELAELTGSLLATTLPASSYFRGDQFNIGFLGTMSTEAGSELASQADLLLAFGASLNPYTTYRGDLLRKARVIHFDARSESVGRYLPADLAVIGDAKLSARALVDELKRRGVHSTGYRREGVEEKIQQSRREADAAPSLRADGLDPRAVLQRLDSLLPAGRTLVVDGGHHFEFSVANVAVPDPSGFVFANEYFSVGCGLAAALGASVARPERLSVFVVGDGGLMMNLGDLDTAVRYRLPMVIVVMDDGGFGSEMHYLRINGLPDDSARYSNPSFAAIAHGMGAKGITVRTLDDLNQVPHELFNLEGPLLLDCKVTSSVRADWVDFLFTAAPVR